MLWKVRKVEFLEMKKKEFELIVIMQNAKLVRI